jgi:tetratricopeptide (TPR) repeat protein
MDRKRISGVMITLAMVGTMLTGCVNNLYNGIDTPPDPTPTAMGGPVKSLAAGPGKEIFDAVKAAEAARANYRYRIDILSGYYNRIGNADKYNDTQMETKNLQTAQWFRWEGLDTVVLARGENVSDIDETALIEELMGARQQWRDTLAKVEALYREKNLNEQATTVHRVIDRLDPARLPVYHDAAEVPPANLKPIAVIPEADQLYDQAYKLFRKGKGLLPMFNTNYAVQRQSVELFKKLIREYPTSNKIAMSAYYIADIYKEYFNRDVLACKWYQRAWEWAAQNPAALTEPARFQAATVYDLRLHDLPRAVECYRASLKYDPSRLGNASYARQRIKALTGKEYTEN